MLSVATAVYDDFDSLWATVQTLREHHEGQFGEIVVVDNNPDSAQGKATRDFCAWVKGDVDCRYIPFGAVKGPALAKDTAVKSATGEFVVVVDSHVMLKRGALGKLNGWLKAHPECDDLLSGPLIYDDRKNGATHFADAWRGEMWGTWATDVRGVPGPSYEENGFEIPACGLGCFVVRRESWLGFNPKFRGFGGEEFYIHDKYRQAGRKCLCLPWFGWLHRFGRPRGVPYPLTLWDKVCNYVLGHHELGLPLDRIHRHFVLNLNEDGSPTRPNGPPLTEAQWKLLTANPSDPPLTPDACGTCGKDAPKQAPPVKAIPDSVTLDDLYAASAAMPNDVNEHCAKLRELASKVPHVTDFGSRGATTVALLAGRPKRMVSHTTNAVQFAPKANGTEFETRETDSLTADIEPTDLLFLDTRHTAARTYAELLRHSPKVKRWIALHGTETFGLKGDDGGPGMLTAVSQFVRTNLEWTPVYRAENNNGMLVLSRDRTDSPPRPGMLAMAKNYAVSTARYVAAGMPVANETDYNARIDACSLCLMRNGEHCSVCGCGILDKSARKSDDCPMGKWPKAEVKT